MPKTKQINWKTSDVDRALVREIVERATKEFPPDGFPWNADRRLNLSMDLEACHLNAAPIDLPKLLAARRFDFLHDVAGISACIDRETAQLTKNFHPRCALSDAERRTRLKTRRRA